MRLEDLTPAHVRSAASIYLEEAWPAQSRGPARDDARAHAETLAEALAGAPDISALFELLEAGKVEDPDGFLRYCLRLGNARYPFMKLVVQEYLVAQEFFFSVDTHDNLDVRPDAPDYAPWQDLKAWNRALKERIEGRWAAAGLPTHADLRALCEGLVNVERGPEKRRLVLVVDDEQSVACGVAALLRARGYDSEAHFSGEALLERLAGAPRPDLVILDFELPRLDGEGVLRLMRDDPLLANVQVLMATASQIDLSRLQRASGLLRKPYAREVLFAMVDRLTGAE